MADDPHSLAERLEEWAASTGGLMGKDMKKAAALLRQMAAPGWRTIDSAPRDGRAIQVTHWPYTGVPPINAVRWAKRKHQAYGWRVVGAEGKLLRYEPTHWAEMLEPPSVPAAPSAPTGETE